MAVAPVDLDGCATRQIRQLGQVIGEESVFDAVHAQLKAVEMRGRRNRVGACLLFARVVWRHGRHKLAGLVMEIFHSLHGKYEVVTLGNF